MNCTHAWRYTQTETHYVAICRRCAHTFVSSKHLPPPGWWVEGTYRNK